ncbi:MAG: GIY-YIG nuclease family protein [bacterium]|nr:GIY-YIG nuclease family protein [bacterium]
MKYIVYILFSKSTDRYYIGQTNNIERRLKEHNDNTKTSYTRRYQPWQPLYKKEFPSRARAVKAERYLKSLKNKERIKQYIAGWRSSTSRGS